MNTIDGVKPNAIIDGECLATVSTMEECEFKISDNHYAVRSGETVFYFTKTHYQTPDIKPILNGLSSPGDKYIIMRKDIISFCEVVKSIALITDLQTCTISDSEEQTALLSFTGTTKSTNKKVFVSKNSPIPEFCFNGELMYKALKAIAYEELTVRVMNGNIIFESDDAPSFLTIIRQTIKQS